MNFELYCRVSMKDDNSTEGDYSAWSTKTNRLSRFLACVMPLARYFFIIAWDRPICSAIPQCCWKTKDPGTVKKPE